MTEVMGIVNVTTDSFSDGGKYLDVDSAVSHAKKLVAEGADIIDVGGESTRPGATRVSEEVELARVIPVITALHAEGIKTSVDTMRASVAAAAAEAGAGLLNDVSGGLADKNMYSVMADTELPVCLMHWKTTTFGDASGAHHTDVVRDVREGLNVLVDNALAAGVDAQAIAIDPGLGFAKTADDNWALLNALPEFMSNYPVLLGASRKRFLASLGVDTDAATAAVTAIAAHHGVWCVRVHNVALSRAAVDVAAKWRNHGSH
ncbi:Dihydropteroate synthase [Corynebacterium pseudotuberculosis]|uniref:dihydropteroate synthase n=1 Tax=Corynebacterium pseudotuberculosis TaxID=1719 RepID=UPI00065DF883|nr:dihydropteroate synthase [Corynebacterium pseudotuberculosis]AKP09405.1 Dihydropteroate synthase [Corynebacterium pseudotuberculosis]